VANNQATLTLPKWTELIIPRTEGEDTGVNDKKESFEDVNVESVRKVCGEKNGRYGGDSYTKSSVLCI
jgi:hypothetical protein